MAADMLAALSCGRVLAHASPQLHDRLPAGVDVECGAPAVGHLRDQGMSYGGLADGIGGVSGTCHSVRSVLLATA